MSDPSNAVNVRIAGEEHAIRASAEPEYTRRCAGFVDERITEVRGRSGPMEVHRAAILAALSITDELFRTREELATLRAEVEGQVQALVRKIDAAAKRSGEGPEDAPRPS